MLRILIAGYVDVLENVLNIQSIFQQMHWLIQNKNASYVFRHPGTVLKELL